MQIENIIAHIPSPI